ncbi:thioesterase II family protein [Pseudoalteromonas peptidolytica]|uniref:thioesterase II family protein n=1 Tax=Pseudoalteromonas peptidolytica TaxID=61150 RepID=UPI00298EADA4|nr:alpha/beta fold hydrolase [Pseudoalteromonas peptidolytica]MDW7549616.1 alpha/beta fold hydrolase [Pseudoalteromonas peptidolytica]
MNNKLFIIPKPNPNATLRLFCFPYAGGSSTIFTPWIEQANTHIELVFVQLPGRGARLMEPAIDNMPEVIEELLLYKDFITSKPYAFFGHSLGSRISYALACELHTLGLPLPSKVFASASRAPHCTSNKKYLHDLPHDAFIAKLRDLNGTPKEVLDNAELMELLIPLLRADFKIADTYVAEQRALPTPIHVFHGVEDEILDEHILAWQALTAQPCTYKYFDGGHFFIHQYGEEMINIINQQLT